jgi:hypothetical protein
LPTTFRFKEKGLEDENHHVFIRDGGWMIRKQHGIIDYLPAENEILKEQFETKGPNWRRRVKSLVAKI